LFHPFLTKLELPVGAHLIEKPRIMFQTKNDTLVLQVGEEGRGVIVLTGW